MRVVNHFSNGEVTAHITIKRQRLKQDRDRVYLQNGEEFEIELFNPHSEKVLATININGKATGNGIVLRPGERVFLERYLDKASKFAFETYQVDGDDDNAMRAIAQNGNVTVRFYEVKPQPRENGFRLENNNLWVNTSAPVFNQVYGSASNTFNGSAALYNATFTANTSFSDPSLTTMSTSSTLGTKRFKTKTTRAIETGMVSEGTSSGQKFAKDTTEFMNAPFHTIEWQLMPYSTRPMTADEIKVYCTECGAKQRKPTHKFCPHCGEKF
jgi:hypothetical protein